MKEREPKIQESETLCNKVLCCTSKLYNRQNTVFPQSTQQGKSREGRKTKTKQRKRVNKGETRRRERAGQQRTKELPASGVTQFLRKNKTPNCGHTMIGNK